MCIRCRLAHTHAPSGLCSVCAIETRREIRRGMSALTSYLAAWAAFDEWLRRRAG